MNVSRDLFLLSAIAFRQGEYNKAASLYASSLSSDDAPEFLSSLENAAGGPNVQVLASDTDAIESITQALASSMMSMVEDDDSENSDDFEEFDPDEPGEVLLPPVLSSNVTLEPAKGVHSSVRIRL